MIRAALLLLLCGSGLVLCSSPVQKEEYMYKGRMMVGVNNPRQAFAGSLVELKLTVERKADQSADVTFAEAKAGQFNKKVYIGDEPLKYLDQMDRVAELEGSSKVHFDRDSGTVMEVKSDEKIWVTNMRKAIVSMLRIPPYLGDRTFVDLERNALRPHGSQTTNNEQLSYFKTEETFAGRCNVSYTMNPDFNDGLWPDSPNSVLPSGGQYFRMHRAIDFDSCKNAVSLQKTSFGNFSRVWESQFKEVQDRSAVGEYLLRKRDDGFFDIKGLTQAGSQYIRPFGQDTGRVVTHTNQTLSLTKMTKQGGSGARVSSGRFQQVGGTKAITTWHYQFVSPASPKQDTKVDWIIYENKNDAPIYPEYAILGKDSVDSQDTILKKTNDLLDQIRDLQLKENDDYRKPYNGTNDGRIAELLNVAARAIRALEFQKLKTMFDATKPKPTTDTDRERIRRQSLLDASLASGSASAMKNLLDAAKAKEIDEIRMGGLLTSWTNNIIDPNAMKETLDYVMTTDPKDHIYLATTAHLNFAKLVQRVCVNRNIKSYAVPEPYIGQKACDREEVGKKFSDHLKQRIQNAKTVWEIMMYTQSLANLGMDENIPILRDIAMSKFAPEALAKRYPVRLGAIHALSRNYPERRQKEKVILNLLPLAENHAEEYRVREAAFITLVSLRPNSTFFERFAADSWRDPSNRMRSLVSATMTSLADSDCPDFSRMSSLARHLLPKMRPVQPSLQDSLHFDFKTHLPVYNIGLESKIAWLQKYRSRMAAPQQMMQALKGDFGGIRVPIMEVYSMYDSQSILSLTAGRTNPHDPQQRQLHEEMTQLAESLEQEMEQSSKNIYLFASAFHYQNFFAFDKDTKPIIIPQVKSLLDHYSNKEDWKNFMPDQTVKYFNPVDILSILPTPFGIPVMVEINAPNNLLNNHMFRLKKENNGRVYNLTLNGNSKATMKTQSFMTLLQPWARKAATAGFDTETSMSLPGQVSMRMNNTYPFGIIRTTLSPRFQGEKPIIHWRSKPLSAIREMGPVSDITKSADLITCLANEETTYRRAFEIQEKFLGLKNKLNYDGDVDFPFQQAVVMEIHKRPGLLVTLLTTPTKHDFALTFKLNMDQSETKNISMATIVDMGYLNADSSIKTQKTGTTESIGQQIAEQISLKLSPEELATSASRRELGDFMFAYHMNYTAPNKRERQYAIVFTGANVTKSGDDKLRESLVMNLMRKGLPGSGSDAERKICLVTSMEEQKAPKNPKDQDKSELYTATKTDVYAGQSCSNSERMSNLKAWMYLRTSEKAMQPCQGHLECSSSTRDRSFRIPYISDAIYDRVDLEYTIEKNLPNYLQNMSYWLSDMAEGAIFPSLVKNRMPDASGNNMPNNKVYINVTRNDPSAVMDAWVHRSDLTAVVRRLRVPTLFDWATPLLGSRIKYSHDFPKPPQPQHTQVSFEGFEASPNSQCIIKPDQVKTYDGVLYPKTPSTCWEVATQVYHQDDSFTILVRQVSASASSQQEVKIIAPTVAKIEILAGKQVKLNDQVLQQLDAPIKDQSGKVVGQIKKTSDQVQVSIPNKMQVTLKDDGELKLELPEQYREVMKGLCGDYNGDKAGELKTPKGCVMTQAQGKVFAASWVPQKSECHEAAIAEYIRQAETIEAAGCSRSMSVNAQRHQQLQQDPSRGC